MPGRSKTAARALRSRRWRRSRCGWARSARLYGGLCRRELHSVSSLRTQDDGEAYFTRLVGWAEERSDVPTIHQRTSCEMVGTLRFAHPTAFYFTSGQPESFAAGNALSPGTTASCL